MSLILRFLFLFLLIVLAPVAGSNAAIPLPLPGGEAETEGASDAAPTPQIIEDTQSDGEDDRIAARIGDIFAEIPAFRSVDVVVDGGVVTLSGSVADAEDIDRAETIAGRVAGVVTVENDLERDLSLDTGLTGLASIGERIDGLVAVLPLLALAIAIAAAVMVVGYLIAGLGGLWRRILPNAFLAELVASAVRFASVVIGIVIALDMLGAAALLGAVLGGAGIIGIALGFAMRDTVENYVASLMLSLRQPFRANDHVIIDDKEGRIIRLTSRATIIMTLDGNHLRIPNGQVFKATILNFTTNPHRRFEFELGIDADDDPNAARRLGRKTLGALPFVLDDPAPEARTEAVGDSNIVIKFLGWVDQREVDWFKARSLAIANVKAALEDAGFGLPEPIYRLRFDPRTTALPFENIGESDGRSGRNPASRATARPVDPDHVDEDIRPADEVAQMVEAERAAEPDEKDLLDSNRPVE
ncbi:mechanosensitive ion channel domain-containing protein [Sphingomicrobium sp. XHP0239]|uniref:mechanosensitive ion channel domain-containing protein n=1 Tax=Sphingomicrobium maritimum TaxID=3133972 RepID=UPI0031CC72EB